MADAVATLPIYSGSGLYAWKFINISDGTGESAVLKIDVSTLVNVQGNVGTQVEIQEIVWAIQGFTSVRLLWDGTTDQVADLLCWCGAINYETIGKLRPVSLTGNTGDLLFTTAGATNGATYDITIKFKVQ